MSFWAQHLPIAPVAVPLVAGATILLLAESRRLARATIAMISVVIQLGVAIMLMSLTDSISVYAIGGWAAPFGIVTSPGSTLIAYGLAAAASRDNTSRADAP